jgi:signal transduction histidine kinase
LRLTRLLRTESLRLAALAAVLFVVGAAALIGIVLWIVATTQRDGLLADNGADIQSVRNGYAEEGIAEAVEVIRQRLGDPRRTPVPGTDVFVLLMDPQGARLAGNMPAMPVRVGTFESQLVPPGTALPVSVLGRGEMLDASHYLFVGRNTHALAATRARIVSAFLWVLLGAIVLAAGGGVLLARRLMRRVDAITATCEAIVAGRLDQRIALHGQGSEWDRLARAINEMLNRISMLLENLQQVSSDVAHDLRTPLTRMRNRLEQARAAGGSTEDHAAAVARAIEDTDQLLSMFAALLRISQVEAGTRAASFKRVDLHALLDGIYELYRPVAADNRQHLSAALDASSDVLGDRELLLQMFSNLVENAIRHTPAGTQIRIELTQQGGTVVASISDSGPGVPVGEFDKVTRRFYRLSSSRTEPGHGLGLALVNAVVHLHGAMLRLSDANPGLRADVQFTAASGRA